MVKWFLQETWGRNFEIKAPWRGSSYPIKGDRDAVAPSWLMKKKFSSSWGNWSTEHKRLFLNSNLFLYSKRVGRMYVPINPEKSA